MFDGLSFFLGFFVCMFMWACILFVAADLKTTFKNWFKWVWDLLKSKGGKPN